MATPADRFRLLPACPRTWTAPIRHTAFAPFVSPATRVLILGSLPGVRSLSAGQYYAHPQNRFWQLVGAAIDREDLAALDYPARLGVLAAAGVGLWDTIASATRVGSLDAAIRDARPAALPALVATLPALRAIAFNGATAARLGRVALAADGYALIDLPSSSPAYAAMPFAGKREHWLALGAYLR